VPRVIPRRLIDTNQPRSPPPDPAEPRLRLAYDHVLPKHAMKRRPRPRQLSSASVSTEAVEHRRRRKRIDPRRQPRFRVFPEIPEHVDKRIANLPRRGERPPVPPIGPNAPPAPDERIDSESDANGDTPHSFGQSSLVARFDDEVDVIPLYGKVKDPEALWVALGSATQSDTERRENMLAA
jgi:hypothetical protein